MYWFYQLNEAGEWYECGYTDDPERAALVAALPGVAVMGW